MFSRGAYPSHDRSQGDTNAGCLDPSPASQRLPPPHRRAASTLASIAISWADRNGSPPGLPHTSQQSKFDTGLRIVTPSNSHFHTKIALATFCYAAVAAINPALAQSPARPLCHICNRSIISHFILADRECDLDSYFRCIAPCNGNSSDYVNGTIPSPNAIRTCINRCALRYGCTR